MSISSSLRGRDRMFTKQSEKMCPLLKKGCIGGRCAWYIQLRGTHPQTGEPVDQYDCALVMLPLLTIENSQQQRQTGAAVESFRNEMVKANESSVRALEVAAQQHLLRGV
jgi:hypothetical protein